MWEKLEDKSLVRRGAVRTGTEIESARRQENDRGIVAVAARDRLTTDSILANLLIDGSKAVGHRRLVKDLVPQ